MIAHTREEGLVIGRNGPAPHKEHVIALRRLVEDQLKAGPLLRPKTATGWARRRCGIVAT